VARLRIPETARSPMVRLASVSRADFESFIESLRSDEPLLARRDLAKHLLEHNTTNLDEDDVRDFLDMTLSLATLRLDQNATAEQVADDISASSDLPIQNDTRTELRKRLAVLLQVPSVQQLSKAADLLRREERVFHEARLTTDMRPIFEDDPSKIPAGAVIVHNLTIEFHTAGGVGEWQVALDESDLAKLRGVVERAVHKGRSLHRFMESAHIMSFEPAEEGENK
jgi:hypothetical protein